MCEPGEFKAGVGNAECMPCNAVPGETSEAGAAVCGKNFSSWAWGHFLEDPESAQYLLLAVVCFSLR